jgi:hypothetical protein
MRTRTTTPAIVEVSTADLATGLPVTLTAPPTYTTTSATQAIVGSSLTAGARYRLEWSLAIEHGPPIQQATTLIVTF